jgi:PilZ domain
LLATRPKHLTPVYGASNIETGRCEHRMEVSLEGRLEISSGQQSLCDRVMIRNLSTHGARVISGRPWHTRDRVNLSETIGDYHLDAEIVYCERLADNRYAVGLKFSAGANAPARGYSHSYW